LKIFFPFLKFMASCRALNSTSEWRITSRVILYLTFTQHLRDEDFEPWKVCPRLEVEPPQAWYYCIFPNSHTLMILLQVDPIFGDEPEIVCEGCYKTKDTYIFAWFSILNVGHYRWLHGLICWLFPNSKSDYLIRTIWRILDFLQLWTITMA
jgi:hypothetical protein